MWVALDWLYAKLDCVEYEMWCRSGKYNGRLEKQNCAKDFLTSVRGTGRNLIHWICYSAYVATCLVKISIYNRKVLSVCLSVCNVFVYLWFQVGFHGYSWFQVGYS